MYILYKKKKEAGQDNGGALVNCEWEETSRESPFGRMGLSPGQSSRKPLTGRCGAAASHTLRGSEADTTRAKTPWEG